MSGMAHSPLVRILAPHIRLCLDLWMHTSVVLAHGEGQRIAELTSFMSVYRHCWALSLVQQNSAVSAPLTEVFLSLPVDSYKSGRHKLEDRQVVQVIWH